MEKKRLSYNNRLYHTQEEIIILERLLAEAKARLDDEYAKIGGRTWWQTFLKWIGWGI